LLEGRTLREIVAKEAPLEIARAVSIMLQASAAVGAAHEAGVIHRDLKPANIFVTQRSDVPAVVKVLDFGIAKLAADNFDEDDAKSITQVGAMIGTPRYMSPEQCNGFELTPASDVYSLGVILYEMLTSAVPFSGSSPLSIALKHSTQMPRPPREIVASIPEDLETLILKTLEKRPVDRPADAFAFREELLTIAERLGLEHAALISAPDLESLRGVGVESPSGRLIIDITKLRESRAQNASSSEATVVASGPRSTQTNTRQDSLSTKPSFSRLDVSIQRRSASRMLLFAGAIVAALLLGGFVAWKIRSARQPAAVANVNATPSPTATPTPTPLPSPSPSPTVSTKPSPSPSPSPDKKRSKVGSFVNKVKRILKKPF